MKSKASVFMKNIISALSSMVKGKLTGVKGKADAIRIRLLVFSLMKSKKLSFAGLSNKIQTLLDKKHNKLKGEEEEEEDLGESSTSHNKALILYDTNMGGNESSQLNSTYELGLSEKRQLLEYYGPDSFYDDDKYPDLTHSLFDEEEDSMVNQNGSVIDLVRNSKENEGQAFKLEDEIDQVADLFIKRFRRQILLQKLDSFKRRQEKLGRGA